MLSKDVLFDREPEAVVVMPLPDGMADVWIRRGIGSAEAENTEDGDGVTVQHFAQEEAYGRLKADEASPEAIVTNLDEWFSRLSSWEPPKPGSHAQQEAEDLSAMRAQVESLAAQVGELTEQNVMLTECLLEMSEEVYG